MQSGRQTDRHDEANSHFLQFCECAENLPVRNLVKISSI